MAGGSFLASDLTAVNTTVAALWREAFNNAQNDLPYQILTTDLGVSSAATRGLDWLGEAPDMVAFEGATRFDGINRYDYSMTHTEYRIGLKVSLADLETDQLGQLPLRVQAAARKAAGHPGRLAFAQLETNPTAFDGAAYFANTHTFGNAANCDNLAGGTGVTSAAVETDLATIRATMMRFQDDTGQAMGLVPDTLVIPPELSIVFSKVLGTVREGVTSDTMGVTPPGQGIVWKAGGYTVIERPFTDTNNWYAFHTGGTVKPLLWSWIAKPAPLNTPSVNDASAVHHGFLEYVFRGHYGVGVSLPQYGISVVNS